MPPKPPSRPRRASSGSGSRSSSRRGGRGRGRGAREKTSAVAPPAHELSRLESLPLTLFHHVLAFVVSCTHQSPQFALTEAEEDLQEVALWSKAVRAHALEMSGQIALGRLRLDVATCSRKGLLEARRQLTLHRAFMRELEVHVLPPVRAAGPLFKPVGAIAAALMPHAPKLEMLDLRGFWCDVAPIVEAAGKHCPQLQSLLLPGDPFERTGQALDRQALMDALFGAMQHWHRTNGGLRQLRLPFRRKPSSFSSSVDYLLRVYTYCPRIEYLDDAAIDYRYNPMHGGDEWIVDRTAWERFYETCTQLREFAWITVPWATDFFEIFGKHKKPQLTDLTLAASMKWDWNNYFEQVGRSEASAMKASGFGATAKRIHRVLQACPALKRLVVMANSRVGTDEETLDTILDLEEYDTRQPPPPFKRENAMNQGLISDKFCEAVVRHCPLLEQFLVYEDHHGLALAMKRVRPIMRFTDGALQWLAKLKHLTRVDVKAVNISGEGLFDLVNSNAIEAAGTRYYDLAIGDEQGETAKNFYKSMQDFLQRLLNHKGELELPSRKVYMCVVNGNASPVDARWSDSVLRRLKGTIRLLRRKFPTITFRVEIEGLTNREFSAIYAFGLYTKGAIQPSDSRWLDIPEDALEEDIFVLEEMMDDFGDEDGDLEDGEGEDDEFFDDEGDHDNDDDHFDGGRPGGFQNERGHFGVGNAHFFNSFELPDIGRLRVRDDEDIDEQDHDFYDHAGFDY